MEKGKKFIDKSLQDEAKLRRLVDRLARHETLLLVVGQPSAIGALPVAVAQASGILVGYLRGRLPRMSCRLDGRDWPRNS